ncbi:BREX system P-loop protein BrxC [Lactiplantibacillus paraxiangfangensis]|uniref:BREX system P-loop protein BrxC n=1 Tax=Lactiplantibacillus paraxiangfangensis TaxID=3076224 RepID=UPI0030C72DDA
MRIKDIFSKSIDRNIKGVITIGDEQEANIKQELEEYVVTHELQKHFYDFFTAYDDSINHDTTRMGVWISGFFGSGKSHFLKILAYLLENRVVDNKPALQYFLDDKKINKQETIDSMQLATSVHNETILFNIDSKAKNGNKSQKDAILNVFWQVFNEKLGLTGVDFWIADLERDLIKNNQYEAFQSKFKELDKRHRSWKDARNGFAFLKGTIKETLTSIGFMSEENASGFIEQLKMNYPLSVEDFAKRVNEYIEQRQISDPDYHLVFLVDEIGQYIGDSQQRMLNLQSVVEDLGTYTHGKAWVIVTSQQAIDQVTENINGQDFSKIQGRFNTRIAMSSANVDEVINKRLLLKTNESERVLSNIYDNSQHAIKNLFSFEGEIERKQYESPQNFADVYPFVPYQYNLLQDTLTAIRQNGSDGKHLANGERSMLAIFQESAQRLENRDINALVPFSIFYEGLNQFLDHTHLIVIQRALEDSIINPDHEEHPFNVHVLETLFMVKYVENFNATLNNIVTLMIDSIEADRIELEDRVKAALNVLIQQGLVEKTTQGYEFLTDAEQDISRKIHKQDVEPNEISQAIGNYLFTNDRIDRKYVYPKLNRQYTFMFNQFVDSYPIGTTNNKMSLKITTLESPFNRDTMELSRLAMSDSDWQIIIDMPAGGSYANNLHQAKRIEHFLRNSSGESFDARAEKIIGVKQSERQILIQEANQELDNALDEADIYVGEKRLEAGQKSFRQRLADAQGDLVNDVYRNLSFIDAIKDDKDIISMFKNTNELVKTNENAQAVQAVLERISFDTKVNSKVSYKSLLDRFSDDPYGYRDIDIKWIAAYLFANSKVKLYVNGEQINLNQQKSATETANYFLKKQYTDKLQFEPRIAVDERKKRDLKDVARELFNKRVFDNDEDETLVRELRDRSIKNEQMTLNEFAGKPNYYPGKDILATGQKLLDHLMNRTDTDSFYDFISRKKDDFLDWHEDMEEFGLFDFYNNPTQMAIWDHANDYKQKYLKSRAFISNGRVKTTFDKIDQILMSNKPEGKINNLKQLNEEFLQDYSAEYDRVENTVHQDITSQCERVLNNIEKRHVSDVFEEKVRASFKALSSEASSAENLDGLVVITTKASTCADGLLTQVDKFISEKAQKERQIAESKNEKKASNGQNSTDSDGMVEPESEPTPKVPVTPEVDIRHISVGNLPIPKNWELTSAEDIDKNLAQLRLALVEQLKQTDQVNLDL